LVRHKWCKIRRTKSYFEVVMPLKHEFIGRETELRELRALQTLRSASLVILEGRRRVGKSRLVEEFAAGQKFSRFNGLAPTPGTDAQSQRNEFLRQLSEQTGLPRVQSDDWGTLFDLLAREVARGQRVVLLDEISWMADKDPTFLGKLKTAWDVQFCKNPRLMLILCGSVSSWIQKNIVSSTAFLGRPSRDIKLEELSLAECNRFWSKHSRVSPYEKLKVLSVTGGIPRYLELINPSLGAEDNIRELLFSRNSVLLDEFKLIFSDTFGERSAIYRNIIASLLKGPASLNDILERTQRTKTGDYSDYLNDLVTAGFLARDYTWRLKTGEISKLSRYRLKDNFLRFYLRYVTPNRPAIEKGFFEGRSLTSLPGWESLLALQFENLVLNNVSTTIKKLGVLMPDVVFANPFFQRKTRLQAGCQIDLVIQTRFDSVYACEIKFSKSGIKPGVVGEMRQKLENLQLPRKFSVRPVLIHVNGVHPEVIRSQFFSQIIDLGELLTA
jgi:AAA+ ATPase superfamily predicted ATPase